MPPLQHHCGDIVWQHEQETRSYTFRCIYCTFTARAFKNFKQHLLDLHSKQLDAEVAHVPEQCSTRLEPILPDNHDDAGPDPLEKGNHNFNIENTAVKNDSSEFEEHIADPKEQHSDIDVDAHSEDVSILQEEFDSHSLINDSDSDSDSNASDVLAKLKLPSDAKEFWMQQHPIMLTFIKEYHKARLLWDANLASHRSEKSRNAACQKIATSLNKRFGLKLECQHVKAYIKRMRTNYYNEQRRLQRKSYNLKVKEAWFYEPLKFLSKPRAETENSRSLPVPQLSHEENNAFIALYQRCRGTWDMLDMACRLRHVRQQAIDEFMNLCRSELNLTVNQNQVQQYVYRIRYSFMKEKSRQLQCESDGSPFKPVCPYFKQTQFLEHHVGPFKCEVCDEVLNGVDPFMMHRAQHDGSMPFTCPICQRGFSRSGNCTTHMRRHTQDYLVSCDECGKRFATTTDLHVHRRNHTGEKPYCCDVCGQRFRTSSFFDRHKRRHEQRTKAKCNLCGKLFFELSALKDHMKAHLNVRDKVCDVCQKAFTCAKYLRQHKEIHAAKKRYICKICSKGFAQYAGLSGHMKSHGAIGRNTSKTGTGTANSEAAAKPTVTIIKDESNIASAIATNISIEIAPLKQHKTEN